MNGNTLLHAWMVFNLSLAAFHSGMDRGPTFVSFFLGRYHFAGSYRYSHVFVVACDYDVGVICNDTRWKMNSSDVYLMCSSLYVHSIAEVYEGRL